MEFTKISLPTAYMIETLRSNGITNEEILTQVSKRDVTLWDNLNSHFDFNDLLQLSKQDPKRFESVINDGYQVKFVTIRGVQNLLKMRFGKDEGMDYELTETGLTNLQLNEEQALLLKQMLSSNCKIQELTDKKIQIDLA